MGFEGKKVLKLHFEDSDLEGLEVVTRFPTIEQVSSVADATDEDAKTSETLRAMAELLCSTLIGWNLENDGVEVPKTADALLSQDFDVAKGIIRAWEDAAFKVPAKLGKDLSSGEPSLEESIPMVALLPSQAS